MASQPSFAQRALIGKEARKRFLRDVSRSMTELGGAVNERLTHLLDEAAPSREMQDRRDAWTLYRERRQAWVDGTLSDWETASTPAPEATAKPLAGQLELVGTDTVDNKIVASRLAQGIVEIVKGELDDLRLRMKQLDGDGQSAQQDVLNPEVLLLLLVERWANVGLPHGAWSMISEVVQKVLASSLKQAYANGNAFLIAQGVLPTIELADRVKRVPSGSRGEFGQGAGANSRQFPDTTGGGELGRNGERRELQREVDQPGAGAGAGAGAGGSFTRRRGSDNETRPGWNLAGPTGGQASNAPGAPHGPSYGGAADETRMMTSATPLARARSRAMGVMGQLKRMLVGAAGASFDATEHPLPSPALAAAIAAQPRSTAGSSDGETVIESYDAAAVTRIASQMRERTAELKSKAQTKNEKATIEIVALMFQAILQETRIPAAIRVWFARLQMPVLRVALAEPDFFGTLDHPARQLIDRMGSCVMGFDASGISGGALEKEIKRVVQVIEQYPETGKRVYQLVYAEFQKFLAQFLTDKASTQKVVDVAQQIEQKETLTIQYTIEMRNMLKNLPVRDEIRQFLFKVWAEVLAVAAVRRGAQHAETQTLKKASTELVWAASAKPDRSDRARVISELPQLLQKLRDGMSLLGLGTSEQEAHIKIVSATLADAFLSKTQAISTAQISEMAERLENLEEFVGEAAADDLPLDAQSIEMMVGIDASMIVVVADGGSKPTSAMLAWAHELEPGAWFTLDHSGRVTQVQFVWHSTAKHLNLFSSVDGRSYLIQAGRLAAYLQAGLLLPQEQEALTVRATRDALGKLEANPERLLS